jgi:hypothetical protein
MLLARLLILMAISTAATAAESAHVSDLSHGWGSNSQWRTAFRRDYQVAGEVCYNTDGEHDLRKPFARSEDRDGLSQEERIELLVSRCFILTERSHTGLWPFDDTLRKA